MIPAENLQHLGGLKYIDSGNTKPQISLLDFK